MHKNSSFFMRLRGAQKREEYGGRPLKLTRRHGHFKNSTCDMNLKCQDGMDNSSTCDRRHRSMTWQCPKLSMHPAPGVHIFRAGCMIFKDVHPDCAHFFSHLSLLHIRRVHGEVPGCTVL